MYMTRHLTRNNKKLYNRTLKAKLKRIIGGKRSFADIKAAARTRASQMKTAAKGRASQMKAAARTRALSMGTAARTHASSVGENLKTRKERATANFRLNRRAIKNNITQRVSSIRKNIRERGQNMRTNIGNRVRSLRAPKKSDFTNAAKRTRQGFKSMRDRLKRPYKTDNMADDALSNTLKESIKLLIDPKITKEMLIKSTQPYTSLGALRMRPYLEQQREEAIKLCNIIRILEYNMEN